MAETALYASLGYQDGVDSWNSIVVSMESVTNSIQKDLNNRGFDDIVVVINVLNDQDTNSVLLYVCNGVALYNAAE